MVGEWDNDPGGPTQSEAGTDEDLLGSGGDEAVDQVLGESEIDLPRACRGPHVVVDAGVVDIDIETVLV